MKKAHIITIGNELLIGDTVNTNASWIGSKLTESGFSVDKMISIPDDYTPIIEEISDSLQKADLTIVTGGLGPTHDDITKKAVADIFDSELVENEAVLNHVKEIFETRGFIFSRSNREQALVPECCEVLFNSQGTAPGMWFERNGHYLAVLPGVPYEMKHLMDKQVSKKVEEYIQDLDTNIIEYFRTAGIPESTLSDKVGDLDQFTSNGVRVAFLPNPSGVTIRISANSEDKLVQLREMLQDRAGKYIYGKGKNLRLAEVLGELLIEKNMTIATAESCTGGLLSNEITDIPGSSRYMLGGVVAYSNDVKKNLLSVSQNSLEQYGAVSKKVALEMAKGVAEYVGADIGVSSTGIAGPSGGTEEKPVGMVWMGFWINGEHFALRSVFTNDRLINKERTVMVILESVRRRLLGVDSLPYELKPQQT
ncbi:competence/damage-inducible protein A [Rhodohalobacter sulfatireducens]|uniref:CinA-like protein n=1 Tax=Rhodohalobacter sulfatireducens TaxID=2911366 RepID=A0ABS9KI05_9BACT|nr:competence/damage-inducible protein A [Rhodohalobacter sulfatireducens]MCG2590486.1 competence/damage-inducible protein A [Rhodohalobacter sulfatireducens]